MHQQLLGFDLGIGVEPPASCLRLVVVSGGGWCRNLRNEKYWILSRHKFLVRPSQFARPGIRRDNNIYINKTERSKVAQTEGSNDLRKL